MMTEHAKIRSQQRGIPPLVIEWLEDFGEQNHDHRGAVVFHFSKQARRRLERAVGRQPVKRMSEWLDAYVVVATDGSIVTVGRRWRRVCEKRPRHGRHAASVTHRGCGDKLRETPLFHS